ncbi:MAG: protein translocase subunit SecF, partial [Propionibacteriaceae bacterium]|nr:protein translocase subunit SecF [Propionibacteriaceae bacterium]
MARNRSASLAHRLYSGEVSYDFVGHRKLWYLVSAALLAVCLLMVLIRGLNLSIDFTGGSEFNVPTPVTATSVDEYRNVAQDTGLPDLGEVRVNTIGDNQVRVQVRALSAAEINQMTSALAEHAGLDTTEVTNNLIGSSWGEQITRQGVIALVVFLVLVALMIWAYFRNWKMSVAALVALAHDLIVVIGVYALLQFTFSPASLIGTLTILGYSLYDTVVVFDRVRDNLRDMDRSDKTLAQLVNLAVNQVLIRSINTTIIGVLPVAALLFAGTFILGTGPLMDLGLALFVGMIAGAYSSIFLAAPLFLQMRQRDADMVERDAHLRQRRDRKASRASH